MAQKPDFHDKRSRAIKSLDPRAKWLAALVGVLGFGSLVYGGYTIFGQIRGPFKITLPLPANQIQNIIPQSEDEKIAELRTKDTDQDGLSDYDEIYLFSTSPYLADTDSDTLSDAAEVKRGTDPNCKEGESCGGIRLVTPDTRISDIFPQFSTSTISLKDKTLGDFRSILLDQGFDKDKLAQIDDKVLVILLEETLKAQNEPAQATSTDAEQIDLDQVRRFLIDLGVPEDEVYSLSNKEIEDLLKTLQ